MTVRDRKSLARLGMVAASPARSASPHSVFYSAQHAAATFGTQQRGLGNQAMQHLLHSRIAQAKLSMSTPGDEYEQEADRAADSVMGMREGTAVIEHAPVQAIPRRCESCKDEDEEIRARELPGQRPEITPRAEAGIKTTLGMSNGQPLQTSARAFFESRFGRDFGDVRVHTGAHAAESAHGIRARAYTVGRDIVLGAGQYEPQTNKGKWLLAHELAHVAQAKPGGGRSSTGGAVAEQDASDAATAALTGQPVVLRHRHDGRHIHYFGEPQHVPELTYISGQNPTNDGFLREATTYHDVWGFAPRTVRSLEEIITDLSAGTGALSRIRIVSHASEKNLYTAMFAGGRSGITKEMLRGFAAGNEAGLSTLFGITVTSGHIDTVLDNLRESKPSEPQPPGSEPPEPTPPAPSVLEPFGLEAAGTTPSGVVETFIQRSIALMMCERGTGGSKEQINIIKQALNIELDDLRQQVQQPPPDGAGVTAEQALALQNAIVGITDIPDITQPTLPPETMQNLGAAVRALTTTPDFRTKLTTMRSRFTGSSWIDIRGCQAGTDPDYMKAVSEFFGTGTNLPHVSAPEWFQTFPLLAFKTVSGDSLASLPGDADAQAALDYWSSLTGVRAQMSWYINFLLEIVRQEGKGNSAQELALNLPPLGGGLQPPPDFPAPAMPLPEEFRLPSPELRRPPIRTGPSLDLPELTNPLVAWAREELNRLSTAHAEFEYYLNAALVLPVQNSATHIVKLFMKTGLENQAMDNWLGSLWAENAPGLEALQKGQWSAESARRTEAVEELNEARETLQMFISPDPRYEEHINEI